MNEFYEQAHEHRGEIQFYFDKFNELRNLNAFWKANQTFEEFRNLDREEQTKKERRLKYAKLYFSLSELPCEKIQCALLDSSMKMQYLRARNLFHRSYIQVCLYSHSTLTPFCPNLTNL